MEAKLCVSGMGSPEGRFFSSGMYFFLGWFKVSRKIKIFKKWGPKFQISKISKSQKWKTGQIFFSIWNFFRSEFFFRPKFFSHRFFSDRKFFSIENFFSVIFFDRFFSIFRFFRELIFSIFYIFEILRFWKFEILQGNLYATILCKTS